jgi:alpha-tubulin suppressor-like RCC1 family protein
MTSFVLASGESESFTATATCESRGVFRGAITASAGADNQSTSENLLTCKDTGCIDCDRTWLSPHLITADGLAFDYIASGDYILQQVLDEKGEPLEGIEVQARFLPGYGVSWPQAVAMRVGDDAVEIHAGFDSLGGQNILYLKVNGELQGTPGRWHAVKDGSRTLHLPSGGVILFEDFSGRVMGRLWDPRALTVVWPQGMGLDGYGVHLSTPYVNESSFDKGTAPILSQLEIQLIRPSTHTGRERGMLGDNDGDPSNDFRRRNGEVLGQDAAMSWTGLYALFGGDWLVRPHECLFDDGCVTPPDFPTSAAVLTADQRALGEAACSELAGYYREACIHDVGLSGSVELVQGFYANTADLNEMASLLLTPSVDFPVYVLSRDKRESLPESTLEQHVFRLYTSVTQVSGEGQYLLSLRPPKGASASFAAGYPGALDEFLTSEGELATAVDVHCGQPDQAWSDRLGEAWPQVGAVQLWSIDPLSGFASLKLSEFPLYCMVKDSRFEAGFYYSLATDKDGQLWGWGNKLGSGGGAASTPVAIDTSFLGDESLVSLSAGLNRVLALDSSGRVWTWGSEEPLPSELDLTPLGGVGVVAIETAYQHYSLLLDELGRVWGWVRFERQGSDPPCLDRKNTDLQQLDLTPLGSAKVVGLSASAHNAFFMDDKGQLWGIGLNSLGQLGNGEQTAASISHCSPVAVDQSAQGGWKAVEFASTDSNGSTYALDESGRVWNWGRKPGTSTWLLSPQQMPFPVEVSVEHLFLGPVDAFALDSTGQIWGWGPNSDGQFGNHSANTTWVPVQADLSALGGVRIKEMATSGFHVLALDESGRLWSWGSNESGELGQGSIGRSLGTYSPARVDDSDLAENPWLP